jgi:DNA relaxase NicK
MTQKTTIDWLRFRTQAEVLAGLEALRGLFGANGRRLNLRHLDHGIDGFEQGCELRIGEWVIGRVDFGGGSQRGWVRWNLTGIACENVKDWDAAADLEALPAAEIRRTDVALTTWQGEVTHEGVEAAYEAGLFCCGGRPPELQSITSSNPRAGRTHYVGKRDADKFFRAYEKGFEMLGKVGEHRLMHSPDVTLIDGCPVEDIYRCEVELKAKTRVIPWEVVERRDQYFAGSYPFLAQLLPGVEADILMRRPERAPQTDLLSALANCRAGYGSILFTALAAYGGDIGRVWDQVVGREHSRALLAAGVLEVEHD